MPRQTLLTHKETLMEAIDRDDSEAVEAIMTEVIKLAVEGNFTIADLTDVLARHDILPGENYHRWMVEKFTQYRDAPPKPEVREETKTSDN